MGEKKKLNLVYAHFQRNASLKIKFFNPIENVLILDSLKLYAISAVYFAPDSCIKRVKNLHLFEYSFENEFHWNDLKLCIFKQIKWPLFQKFSAFQAKAREDDREILWCMSRCSFMSRLLGHSLTFRSLFCGENRWERERGKTNWGYF